MPLAGTLSHLSVVVDEPVDPGFIAGKVSLGVPITPLRWTAVVTAQ
jgi:hypothetical protein